MFPLYILSLAFRFTVTDPCLVAGGNSLQNIYIFLITCQDLRCNLHALLLVQTCKLCAYLSCSNFMVLQVIMLYAEPQLISKCPATADSVICWFSLTMTCAVLMWAYVCDIDDRSHRDVYLILDSARLRVERCAMSVRITHPPQRTCVAMHQLI